jgi:exopolyphosphatase/guanosine-5'-triphosphate,3'-diphosphate pyrophosphatase
VRDGVDLRILSGGEEARLGALAVMHTLPVTDGTAADLGGGSLQLTRLRRGRIVRAASLPLGTVYTTRRFLREDPPGVREVRALRQEIREQALGVLPRARRGDALVGLGGTVRALARLYLAGRSGRRRSRHGLRLRQADLTGLREVLERRTVRQRRRLPGLNPERADIILAGAVTLEELMIFGGYDVLTVCAARVHDGLLWREALGTGGRR